MYALSDPTGTVPNKVSTAMDFSAALPDMQHVQSPYQTSTPPPLQKISVQQFVH